MWTLFEKERLVSQMIRWPRAKRTTSSSAQNLIRKSLSEKHQKEHLADVVVEKNSLSPRVPLHLLNGLA